MEILKIESLHKSFGGVKAINSLSFSVLTGQRVAIIGPNGAGKTTLLNLISGIIYPTSGRIFFLGRDITDMRKHKRSQLGIARSFQVNRLLAHLTIFNNLLLSIQATHSCRYHFFHSILKYEHLLSKAAILLESIDLWKKRDELVKNLGYGEQRRIEIALGLASQPKLLLLDEPSAGLTSAESVAIVKMIQDLGRDITVGIVAHDMDLVFSIADRILVLHYGEIIADGAPEAIRNDRKVREIYLGAGKRNA